MLWYVFLAPVVERVLKEKETTLRDVQTANSTNRVNQVGGCRNFALGMRSAVRGNDMPILRLDNFGFCLLWYRR